MNVDLSFFDTVKAVWFVFFGFFPEWFQKGVFAVILLVVVFLGAQLAQKAKDLFWPF